MSSGANGLDLLRPAPESAWPMYRSMVGVGLACGLLIVTVFELTKPRIAANQAAALRAAILQVLPAARSSATFRLDGERFVAVEEAGAPAGPRVYAAYDDAQGLVGLAVEAQGMGYQDVIRVLYGYSPADDAIVGIRVLESKETPGLGDKIEKDRDFLANFARLDCTLSEDGTGMAHAIVPVKHGTKKNPWEVDAITGATISSNAIARILAGSTAEWVPRMRAHLDDFRHPE